MVFEFDIDKRKREAEESEVGQGEKRKALTFPVMEAREKKGLPPTINRAETLGFSDFLRTGKKIDPRSMKTDGFDDGQAFPQTSDEGISNMAFESDDSKAKFAKDGFMGMIDTKTMFTVGEGGKKEHVTRKKSKKKSNNIFDVGGF